MGDDIATIFIVIVLAASCTLLFLEGDQLFLNLAELETELLVVGLQFFELLAVLLGQRRVIVLKVVIYVTFFLLGESIDNVIDRILI